MKIIPSKILRDIFTTLVIIQLSFTLLFIVFGLTFQGIFDKIPLTDIPFIVPYVFPFSQYYSCQFTIVLTVCIAYSRIKTSRELIALQTSGISAFRVMVPAFLLGLVMSFFSWYMGELHQSWGKYGINRAFSMYAETIFYNILAEKGNITFSKYSLNVEAVDGKTLINPVCVSRENDSGEETIFSADTARVDVGAAHEFSKDGEPLESLTGVPFVPETHDETVVRLTFEHVNSKTEGIRAIIPETKVLYLSVRSLPVGQMVTDGRDDYPPGMSQERLARFEKECREKLKFQNHQMAVAAVRELLCGNAGFYNNLQWEAGHEAIYETQMKIKRVEIEPYRRLALALNCFCLTWVCTPLALLKGGNGALSLFTKAALPFMLIFYFPLMLLTLNLSKQILNFPPELQLIPNITAFFIGILLIRRAM